MLGDWGPGGILNHTKCLLKELRACGGVEVYCIGEDEPYVGGKYQGHDIRKLFQLRRVIKKFKPDVVHVQKFCLVNFFYLKFFTSMTDSAARCSYRFRSFSFMFFHLAAQNHVGFVCFCSSESG